MSRLVVFFLVIVLQEWMSTADSPATTDDAGNLEWVMEAYGELKEKIVSTGGVVAELVSMYYEDHVKPMTDPYIQWAKDKSTSVWDNVKHSVSSYTST